MSNMSYCRFENTVEDMKDCEEFMSQYGDPEKQLSDDEKKAFRQFIKICKRIAEDYS